MPKIRPTAAKPADPPQIHSVAFVSLGCPKNLVDSEKMLGLLAEDGIAITSNHDDADAIVINTCGFLEASKTESLEVIREAIAQKTAAHAEGRHKRIIVAGCLVQRQKAQLLQAVPEVDALVGVFDRENIVSAVRGGQFENIQNSAKDLGTYHAVSTFISKPSKSAIGQGYRESDRARLRLTPRHYAYLRISEGCNQGCTFCTIPSIRGRMRSKPLPDILAEAEELLADGAVELNLIGQDTTSYGSDIGYTAAGEGLPGMLRALNALVTKKVGSGKAWIRLMYAYPSCFTDEMIRTLADCQNVVKYIDMPLQHINDQILHTMRRKVTRAQIETLLHKLRTWVPGITLRTTFISGFPTETDAQHADLLQFVQDFGFENVGIFEYSPEGETPAGRLHLQHPVPSEVAAARKEQIMLAQQKIVLKKNQAFVGSRRKILVDSTNPRKKTAVARHAGQAPDIDGSVLLSHCPPSLAPGELLNATVTDFNYYDLLATPLPSDRSDHRHAHPEIEIRKSKITNPTIRLSLPVMSSVESRSKRR